MLADFLTKPLLGQLFRSFRDALLGQRDVQSIIAAPLVQPNERAEGMRTEDTSTEQPGKRKQAGRSKYSDGRTSKQKSIFG
jgi:hypothetical protein